MKKFRYIQDVEDWLEPMDYQGFWYAIEPYDLVLQDRKHCDHCIAVEGVPQETVLEVLKGLARMELTQKLGLERRPIAPWLKLVETH